MEGEDQEATISIMWNDLFVIFSSYDVIKQRIEKLSNSRAVDHFLRHENLIFTFY